jgi:hypothetical protein
MQTIQTLVNHHSSIQRDITNTDEGIKSYTWSEDPEISGLIQQHVAQMKDLTDTGRRRIRQWDPLFRTLFDHSREVDLVPKNDEKGVHVVLSGSTECGTKLAQLHAEVVSDFVSRGREAVREAHEVSEEARC